MAEIRICGGRRLQGKIWVQGSKNAVLPIMAAAVLHPGVTVLENVPGIEDVEAAADIIRYLGGSVERTDGKLVIDAGGITQREVPEELGERMRSSVLFLGALLARLGECSICRPGGCAIGSRPIDLHLRGLEELGAEIVEADGRIIACRNPAGRDSDIRRVRLLYPSVGATEQLLLAASSLSGKTVLEGCAREPEIISLCEFLACMGAADIRGSGTDVIVIIGGKKTRDICFSIPGDRIAAGTYLAAGAITGGDVCACGVYPGHIWTVLRGLGCMGCRVDISCCYIGGGSICNNPKYMIRVRGPRRLKAIPFLETGPYPGFPTDMQSVFLALNAAASGNCVIRENVFEDRLKMAKELNRMGACIQVEGNTAYCRGVPALQGCRVNGTDLRSGAGLILAGLAACGETVVTGYEYVLRGYEYMDMQLKRLGADVFISE